MQTCDVKLAVLLLQKSLSAGFVVWRVLPAVSGPVDGARARFKQAADQGQIKED